MARNYLNVDPLLREAFANFQLVEITPPQSLVRSFRLDPVKGEPFVLLTFTPEGLIIQGPLGADLKGVFAGKGSDLNWFCKVPTQEALLESFYPCKIYQEEVAYLDLLQMSANSPKGLALCRLAEDTKALSDQGILMRKLLKLGFAMDVISEIGMEYPLQDAGWICAIHAKFVELWLQVS